MTHSFILASWCAIYFNSGMSEILTAPVFHPARSYLDQSNSGLRHWQRPWRIPLSSGHHFPDYVLPKCSVVDFLPCCCWDIKPHQAFLTASFICLVHSWPGVNKHDRNRTEGLHYQQNALKNVCTLNKPLLLKTTLKLLLLADSAGQ